MRKLIFLTFLSTTLIDSLPEKTAKLYVRTKPEIILRESPTVKSKAIARIPFGHLVLFRASSQHFDEQLGQKGVWYEVQNGYNNPQKGWVFAPLLRESPDSEVLVIENGKAVPETTPVSEIYFDKSTGLYWTSCNAEQIYDAGRCKGVSDQDSSTEEAEKYCSSLKLKGLKWALPEITELKTITGKKFSTIFPYSELGFYVSATMTSDGRHDLFLSLQIPNQLELSVFPQGSGMVKCFAKK